jgi:hypothetical protein
MVNNKLYSHQNFLTGSIPSEAMKLPNFDPEYVGDWVGEFMLRPFNFSWCIT